MAGAACDSFEFDELVLQPFKERGLRAFADALLNELRAWCSGKYAKVDVEARRGAIQALCMTILHIVPEQARDYMAEQILSIQRSMPGRRKGWTQKEEDCFVYSRHALSNVTEALFFPDEPEMGNPEDMLSTQILEYPRVPLSVGIPGREKPIQL